jgi:hypothetical protein
MEPKVATFNMEKKIEETRTACDQNMPVALILRTQLGL